METSREPEMYLKLQILFALADCSPKTKAAFTLQVLMTNSDFVTIADFFGRRACISFKSDPYPMCAFYTALDETSQK